MAVVEIGTWNVRVGYSGDISCTQVVRALSSAAAPDETDFVSILRSGSSSREATVAGASSEDVSSLWSLRSLQSSPSLHMNHLRTIKRGLLGCAESDPLMLVVPEVWHERAEVMESLFGLVLEEPGLTSALYCCRPSVCWALVSGRTSAVVVDVGHSHTTATAVLDGYALRHTVDSSAVGGAAVSAQLETSLQSTLLSPAGVASVSSKWSLALGSQALHCALEDMVSDVKQCYGFVAHVGRKQAPPAALQLKAPDGTRLSFTSEQRSMPFEVFFSPLQPNNKLNAPSGGGVGSAGGGASAPFNVATMAITCKNRVDPEWQLHTVHHVLAGAGSLVTGFSERFWLEAKERDSAYFRYERDGAGIVARSADGAWSGAAMAASSSSFEPLWVTRSEWEEEGVSCLYRKMLY